MMIKRLVIHHQGRRRDTGHDDRRRGRRPHPGALRRAGEGCVTRLFTVGRPEQGDGSAVAGRRCPDDRQACGDGAFKLTFVAGLATQFEWACGQPGAKRPSGRARKTGGCASDHTGPDRAGDRGRRDLLPERRDPGPGRLASPGSLTGEPIAPARQVKGFRRIGITFQETRACATGAWHRS
jgi:hypothetical protein